MSTKVSSRFGKQPFVKNLREGKLHYKEHKMNAINLSYQVRGFAEILDEYSTIFDDLSQEELGMRGI